jgi:hypothetical protein
VDEMIAGLLKQVHQMVAIVSRAQEWMTEVLLPLKEVLTYRAHEGTDLLDESFYHLARHAGR